MENNKCQRADGGGQIADDKCQMADDERQMANDECQVTEGELQVTEGELQLAEVSLGPIVGDDSDRVIENSTNDKIGILSHEDTHAADQPGQGDGVGQSLPGDVMPPKATNKANLESEQSPELQGLKSGMAGAGGRKQSKSSRGKTRRKPRSRDGRPARKSGRSRHAGSGQ